MKVKIIFTVILCLNFFIGEKIGYTYHSPLYTHFLFILSHANIFHLLGNILCLWLFRNKLHFIPALLISILASFLPNVSSLPTYGFSGVLFAICGIMWGKIERFKDMCTKCVPFIIVTAFLPNVNFMLHLYCLLLGYLYVIFKNKLIWLYQKRILIN